MSLTPENWWFQSTPQCFYFMENYPLLVPISIFLVLDIVFPWIRCQLFDKWYEIRERKNHTRNVVSISFTIRQPDTILSAWTGLIVVLMLECMCYPASSPIFWYVLGHLINFALILTFNPDTDAIVPIEEQKLLNTYGILHLTFSGILFIWLFIDIILSYVYVIGWSNGWFNLLFAADCFIFAALFVSYIKHFIDEEERLKAKLEDRGAWSGVESHFEHLYILLCGLTLALNTPSVMGSPN